MRDVRKKAMPDIDPYRQLAVKLLFKLDLNERRAIAAGDTKIITRMLRAECRDLDWNGLIIDTLYADLHSIPDARWVKMQVEGLGDRLITRFDFERLRHHLTSLDPKL